MSVPPLLRCNTPTPGSLARRGFSVFSFRLQRPLRIGPHDREDRRHRLGVPHVDQVRKVLDVGAAVQFKGEVLRVLRDDGLDADVGDRRVVEVLVALVGQVQPQVHRAVHLVLRRGLGDEGDVPMDDDPIDDADVEGGDDLGDELADDEMAPEEDEDVYDDDLASRVDNIEQILKNIAEKLGVSAGDVDADDYQGDDNLFDNAEGDEEPIEDEVDVEMPMESKQTKNGMPIFETANFRKVMKESGMESFKDGGRVPNGNMNKLDDFGKHPAYQKKVMDLPPKDMKEFPGYYDMNDESTYSDAPYGEKIGDSAPFDLTPEKVQNAIAESIKRVLKKKSNRGQE